MLWCLAQNLQACRRKRVKSLGRVGLTSVTIPSSVKRIGSYAFLDCDNLKSVKVPKECDVAVVAFSKDCKIIRY